MPSFPELNALSRFISMLGSRFSGPTTVQQNPNSSYDPRYDMRRQPPIQQPGVYDPNSQPLPFPVRIWNGFGNRVFPYLPRFIQQPICAFTDPMIGGGGNLSLIHI